MIWALIDGERRGEVLADLARGRMRAKIGDLSKALEGRFGDQHALMCQLHLEHVAQLNEKIARLDAQVEAMMVTFVSPSDHGSYISGDSKPGSGRPSLGETGGITVPGGAAGTCEAAG